MIQAMNTQSSKFAMMKLKRKHLALIILPCFMGCSKTDSLFDTSIPYENLTYDATTIVDLPPPVQRYFSYALVDGQEYINYLRLKHSGTFKTDKDKEWMNITGEQYFIANPPGFLWIGETSAFRAKDSYVDGEGNLSVYLFGMVRIIKEEGEKVNQAELLRWLGESVWMPTNFLPDERKTWTPIDDYSALLSFTYEGLTVWYVVNFDDDGRIVSLQTDRYMEDRLVPWKGEVSNYVFQDGMMVPADTEASWLLEDGNYTYARFHVEEFEYGKPEKY